MRRWHHQILSSLLLLPTPPASVVGEALRAQDCFLFQRSHCVYSLVSRPRQSARAESRPHAPWRFSPTQLRPHRPLRGGAPAAEPDGKCPSRSAACAAREPGGGRFGACATHAGPCCWARGRVERGWGAVRMEKGLHPRGWERSPGLRSQPARAIPAGGSRGDLCSPTGAWGFSGGGGVGGSCSEAAARSGINAGSRHRSALRLGNGDPRQASEPSHRAARGRRR